MIAQRNRSSSVGSSTFRLSSEGPKVELPLWTYAAGVNPAFNLLNAQPVGPFAFGPSGLGAMPIYECMRIYELIELGSMFFYKY